MGLKTLEKTIKKQFGAENIGKVQLEGISRDEAEKFLHEADLMLFDLDDTLARSPAETYAFDSLKYPTPSKFKWFVESFLKLLAFGEPAKSNSFRKLLLSEKDSLESYALANIDQLLFPQAKEAITLFNKKGIENWLHSRNSRKDLRINKLLSWMEQE